MQSSSRQRTLPPEWAREWRDGPNMEIIVSDSTKEYLMSLNPTERRKYMNRLRPRRRTIIKGEPKFEEIARSTKKSDLSAQAEQYRTAFGMKARVISNNDGSYSIFVGGKDKRGRRYNYHTAGHEGGLSLLERAAKIEGGSSRAEVRTQDILPNAPKKRNFWQRLFGRKSKTPVAIDPIIQRTRSQELDDQEVEDFIRLRDEAQRSGKTRDEAVIAARKGAQILRERKERNDVLEEKQKALEKKLRKAKNDEIVAEYYEAVDKYEEDVPLSTIAQYNSLEIATTSTGLVAGSALAGGTALAAWPTIPIAGAVGWIGAKAIRGNWGGIGLKQGVNNTLDVTESIVDNTIQSIRVSKDNEEYPSSSRILFRVPKKKKPKKPKIVSKREAKGRKRGK
tara:strand:+ start:666 stop:1847 length:1182 start_codon:yes stop_codon:yes gene_type:complete